LTPGLPHPYEGMFDAFMHRRKETVNTVLGEAAVLSLERMSIIQCKCNNASSIMKVTLSILFNEL
jgi:hypothetical protein